MVRKLTLAIVVLALGLVFAVPTFAGAPNFSPQIYADGEAWGTKGVTELPAPTEDNVQSYDKLFVITNGVEGQLPVSEAAPGNPNYNGGRWFTHTVTWDDDANRVLLTSYDDILEHSDDLTITAGSPDGGPLPYFECPLLPVK